MKLCRLFFCSASFVCLDHVAVMWGNICRIHRWGLFILVGGGWWSGWGGGVQIIWCEWRWTKHTSHHVESSWNLNVSSSHLLERWYAGSCRCQVEGQFKGNFCHSVLLHWHWMQVVNVWSNKLCLSGEIGGYLKMLLFTLTSFCNEKNKQI